MILFLILSCEEETFDNPVDPDTELNPDNWALTNLTIEILTDSDALLSWQKSEIEAAGFKIERQNTTGAGRSFVEVGSSNTTIYIDTTLLTGNEYLYRVCAYAGDNQSTYTTSSDTIVTSFPAPYNMTAVLNTDNKIELAWSDSTAYESGFVIERKDIISDVFTVLDSTVENTYQDTTIALGNEYIYKVCAYSQYNTSSYTDTALVKYWLDCLGVLAGDALEDACGICDNNPSNDNTPLTGTCDCEGTPDGTAVEDCTGLCGGSATGCSVYDIDGNGYTKVTIGTQEWLVQNLKTTKYNDGSEIPTGYSNEEWIQLETDAYAVYPTQTTCGDDCADVYGNLYNWFSVDDSRGLCPDGWHVPSDDEWTVLTDYLGGSSIAGGKMQETGSEHWNSSNTGATNESGFTGLPAGTRFICCGSSSGGYKSMGNAGYFWSSSDTNSNYAWYRYLLHNSSHVYRAKYYVKRIGLSIRCLGDDTIDCLGVLGGDAVYDNCNTCDNEPENDCLQDCAGTWGGDLVDDACGVCDGDNSPNTGTCDCNSTPNGTAILDNCNICSGGDTGVDACILGCTNEWGVPATCSVYDIDGNGYTKVTIGTQEWLVQNLKTTKYNDGSEIPTGFSNSEWAELETGAYAVYPIDSDDWTETTCVDDCADVYSNLYNWFAVDDDRGICPDGWHIPTYVEWTELENYLGSDAGSQLAGRADLWYGGNETLVNNANFGTSGFTALPAGTRSSISSGGYYDIGKGGYFWSSTDMSEWDGEGNSWSPSTENAIGSNLIHNYSLFQQPQYRKEKGLSIRCLKD